MTGCFFVGGDFDGPARFGDTAYQYERRRRVWRPGKLKSFQEELLGEIRKGKITLVPAGSLATRGAPPFVMHIQVIRHRPGS